MKKIFLTVLLYHLLVILLINIYGASDAIYNYYQGAEYKKNKTLVLSEKIAMSYPVSGYASFAGTNTSYGFYAPNVGSQFLTWFSVYDSNGVLLGKKMYPHFNNTESVMRFSLCTSLMQEKLAQQGRNDLLNDYLKVMLHQLALNIKNEYPGGQRVEARVYLHVYPEVNDYLAGKKEELVKVDQFDFQFTRT